MKTVSIASAALVLGLAVTGAHAQTLSLGRLFGDNAAPVDRAAIMKPGHDHYSHFAGVEDVPKGNVYASGYYTSRASAMGVHDHYTH